MRLSQFPLNTLKESPADAELISHKLMLRAGLIRRLASGLYTWMPIGLRVLRKLEGIVREEMNRAGAVELLMPTVQPAELWQESLRWAQYGPELLRLKDRHDRDFCFGPTHEEVITDLARRELRSYKQLPVNYYQIQTKFRDEVRPRFGVMRAREFLMKDAYSFHLDQSSLEETYQRMYEAYSRIFSRIGLDFRAVQADTGSIGGNKSHEFHVLADSGEDAIAFSADGQYAANVELAAAPPMRETRAEPRQKMAEVSTPGKHSIEDVSAFLNVATSQCVKTLLLKGANTPVVAVVLRGDHELNLIKAAKFPQIAQPVTFAEEAEVVGTAGCNPGSLGPVDLKLPMLIDSAAAELVDFVCGANKNGKHFVGVNWGRDLPEPAACDIRKVCDGDRSPDGNSIISIRRGIEVGHIFQLGDKYSRAMKAEVLDEQGNPVTLTMGCYGIGVSRLVAAAIEQSYDDRGIIWPMSIAPFTLAIAPLNMHKSDEVKTRAESLYASLTDAGYDVLMDDRDVRPGAMFADLELIGIPHRITVGDRGIKKGVVEYQARNGSESSEIPLTEVMDYLSQRIG